MLVYFMNKRLYKLQMFIRRKLKHCVTEGQCILFCTQFSNVCGQVKNCLAGSEGLISYLIFLSCMWDSCIVLQLSVMKLVHTFNAATNTSKNTILLKLSVFHFVKAWLFPFCERLRVHSSNTRNWQRFYCSISCIAHVFASKCCLSG
jgi:hypothetical protein